jgi:hypothetical protein
MKRPATLARHRTRLTLLRPVYAVGAVALSLTLAVSQPRPAAADPKGVIVVPAVPANLEVPAGNQVYLEGHAVGTQDYICLPCPNAITPAAMCPASGLAWAFYAPQATLFDIDVGHDKQIITHFLSPNPAEGGTPRPTWRTPGIQAPCGSTAVCLRPTPLQTRPSSLPARFRGCYSLSPEPKLDRLAATR